MHSSAAENNVCFRILPHVNLQTAAKSLLVLWSIYILVTFSFNSLISCTCYLLQCSGVCLEFLLLYFSLNAVFGQNKVSQKSVFIKNNELSTGLKNKETMTVTIY